MKWSKVDLFSLAQELLYVQGALLFVVFTIVNLGLRYHSLGGLSLGSNECQFIYYGPGRGLA